MHRCPWYLTLVSTNHASSNPGLVSANRWLRGIKMYRFPWYLTLVSINHASSNPGQSSNHFGTLPRNILANALRCPLCSILSCRSLNLRRNLILKVASMEGSLGFYSGI